MGKLSIIFLLSLAVSAQAGLTFQYGGIPVYGEIILLQTDLQPLTGPYSDLLFEVGTHSFMVGQAINLGNILAWPVQWPDINTLLGLNQPIYVIEVPDGLGLLVMPEPATCFMLAAGMLFLRPKRSR
jgi:hypothetical protein